MRGEPIISFAAHEDRAGAGAHSDFETMLALLIAAIEGEDTHLIQPNPGDWGIDVLIGDLHGAVRIWQAKYFRNGATKRQQGQIRDSFASAIRAANQNGYTVQEWLLCISSSMDGPTAKWWNDWKRSQQQDTGVTLTLWDETTLRRLLLRPEATHVRQAYYGRYPEPSDSGEVELRGLFPVPVLTMPLDDNRPWSGGDVVSIGRNEYLLHDTPTATKSTSGAQIWREATADLLPGGRRVRLRQASTGPRAEATNTARQALREQARLLTRLDDHAMLPVLVDLVDGDRDTTLVASHPPGRLWQDAFGPASGSQDRLTAAALLAAAAHVCTALRRLHRHGQQHRDLSPNAVVVSPTGHGQLRDLGRACLLAAPGDGHITYRAPEQTRAPYLSGPPTDIFQLSALLHHTLTGHPTAPLPPPR